MAEPKTHLSAAPTPILGAADLKATARGSSQASLADLRFLLTPEEAGKALALSRTTVYALMQSGRLPFVRIGRSRRLPVAGLRQFVLREAQQQGFPLPELSVQPGSLRAQGDGTGERQ